MAKEIERKFLVTGDAWRNAGVRMRIVQAYLLRADHSTLRVRVIDDKEAFLTIKGKTVGISRDEFEYPIELPCARLLLQDIESNQRIEKFRTRVDYRGHIWEVDEFLGENSGLIIAEIELDNPDEPFEKPDWIGEEVSGVTKYYNSRLLANPYKNW